VPVNAVVTGVEYAILEPADVQIGTLEGGIPDYGRESNPVQAFCRVRPELFAVFNGFLVNSFVFLLID
jgi:hypothetical protein